VSYARKRKSLDSAGRGDGVKAAAELREMVKEDCKKKQAKQRIESTREFQNCTRTAKTSIYFLTRFILKTVEISHYTSQLL
jgi:hypothetical protein